MNDEILVADALPWLRDHAHQLDCIVTSLPDAHELGITVDHWELWFRDALDPVCDALRPGGAAIFYQTDRRSRGIWHSKADLIMRAARRLNLELKWHKIVLRNPAGTPSWIRPGYAHLICVGRPPIGPGTATPDVIEPSRSLYTNGMPFAAARVSATWAVNAGYRELVDPFCGLGTSLVAARRAGLRYLGIDVDPEQVRLAEELLSQQSLAWWIPA